MCVTYFYEPSPNCELSKSDIPSFKQRFLHREDQWPQSSLQPNLLECATTICLDRCQKIWDFMLYQKKTRSRLKSGKSSQITEYSLSQVLDFVHSVVPFLSISDSVPKSPRTICLFLFTQFLGSWNLPTSKLAGSHWASSLPLGKGSTRHPSPLEEISGRRHLCTSPKARSKEPDSPR